MTRGPLLAPQRLRLGVNTALLGVTKTCLNEYQRLDPAFNKKSGNLAVPPYSPARATIDPEDGTVAESSKSTRDHVSLDSESSRENVDDSDLGTASRDCISCSDTDEVSVQTACKKYWKRVQASCRLSKGSLWMEAQLKRISDSCQDVWGHNHKSIRTEQDHTLVEDCNSSEMWKMMVRTDQLLCIAEATGYKIYTRDLEAGAHGRSKTQVLLLKQYHYYQYHERGITRAMVGLQGLRLSDTFWHSNVSASVGLKLFCPWCFKLGV